MELVKFTEELAKEYASWKYASPYDVYNLPLWEEMKQNKFRITTEEGRKDCYAYAEEGNLVGVVSFKETPENIYTGIALSPNLCGKGLGRMVLALALEEYSKNHNRTKPFYVEIRAWNERSIKTCQKCGFVIVDKKLCKGKDGNFEGVCLELK